LIILDFEANCDEEKTVPIEIIEFPCVVYSVKENKIIRELDFHHFVPNLLQLHKLKQIRVKVYKKY
jgi:inhibitor of KinA sporulation pathway (predicted exonuclease)